MSIKSTAPTHESLPIVAIVGRVNVGKSTLFNHITDSQKAMISREAGTTRTRNIETAHWREHYFRLVDTGGLTYEKDTVFEKEIQDQVKKTLAEASLIIFLVDLKSEPVFAEKQLAKLLISLKKPIIFVGNKADNNRLALRAHEKSWRALKCGEPIPVSASTGRGIGDLLDLVVAHPALESGKVRTPKIPEGTIKIALVGKPNVGKSSLFNALIGEEKVIVSSIPHTTRETHDTLFEWEGRHFLFIDTAGIRRKSNIEQGLERLGVRQAFKTIEEAHMVLFVVDASSEITHQDKALAGIIEEQKKPLIMIANKWDIAKGHIDNNLRVRDRSKTNPTSDPRDLFKQYLTHHFRFIAFTPMVFVSAKTHQHITDILPEIVKVDTARLTLLDPHILEDAFKKITARHNPVKGKGVRHPQIFSIKQVVAAPPVFELAVKRNTDLAESYVKYLEHAIRKEFGFEGVPIVFYIKKVAHR